MPVNAVGGAGNAAHTAAIESALLLYVLDVAISTVSMWLAPKVTALHATFQIGRPCRARRW